MPSTYDKIATYTVPSAQASHTFSAIPSTYTDLVLIITGLAGTDFSQIFVNGDTAGNYGRVRLTGNGSAAASFAGANAAGFLIDAPSSTVISSVRANFMNYANTTTFKTVIARADATSNFAEAFVGTWRNTAAITSITCTGSNYGVGTMLTLYGIKAA